MGKFIGLDLDNTVVRYDDAFARVAAAEGFLPADFHGGKAAVRRAVCGNPRLGIATWTYLQGIVYGPGIDGASLYPGVEEFCRAARADRSRLRIFSHKPRFAAVDATRTDMRRAALDFLAARGFLQLIPAAEIGFYETLTDKVRAIAASGCDAFVDDLPKVLHHEDFPEETRKMLFVPHDMPEDARDLTPYRTWPAMTRALVAPR